MKCTISTALIAMTLAPTTARLLRKMDETTKVEPSNAVDLVGSGVPSQVLSDDAKLRSPISSSMPWSLSKAGKWPKIKSRRDSTKATKQPFSSHDAIHGSKSGKGTKNKVRLLGNKSGKTESPSVSHWPTLHPSESPSLSWRPSSAPSPRPSTQHSTMPSLSSVPSGLPSDQPSVSHWPTSRPSSTPSVQQSTQPSRIPSTSSWPSQIPTTSSKITLEEMKSLNDDLSNLTFNQVSLIKAAFEDLGYDLIATPPYNAVAESLRGSSDITENFLCHNLTATTMKLNLLGGLATLFSMAILTCSLLVLTRVDFEEGAILV